MTFSYIFFQVCTSVITEIEFKFVFLLKLDSIIFTFHWHHESLHFACLFCLQVIIVQFLWSEMIHSSQKEEESQLYFGSILVMVCSVKSQFEK